MVVNMSGQHSHEVNATPFCLNILRVIKLIEREIIKARNINGKKSYQAKHNGKVVDERFDDESTRTSRIGGRSRENALL